MGNQDNAHWPPQGIAQAGPLGAENLKPTAEFLFRNLGLLKNVTARLSSKPERGQGPSLVGGSFTRNMKEVAAL